MDFHLCVQELKGENMAYFENENGSHLAFEPVWTPVTDFLRLFATRPRRQKDEKEKRPAW